MSNVNDISNISPSKDCVLVAESNLTTGIIYKNRHILDNVKYWHKFVVHYTENLSRNEVLKAILDHVHPLDLIPVFYTRDTRLTSYFLARNCAAAIEKMCKDNLIVPVKLKNRRPFKLSLVLNFSTINEIKIDVSKNVSYILQKRFILSTKTLDLNKLYEDEELTEFCPLSQPKIMYFVLHIAKNCQPSKIILTNNDIKLLNPLEVLQGVKLSAIDLSNNLISSLSDLYPLKYFDIREVNLDGNPLCAEYDEYKFIEGVREHCPNIEVLDNILIRQGKYPVGRKNFFCDDSCLDMVNQFLEHFFTVYDSKNRGGLNDLYHRNAMFSLTSNYIPNQLTSSTAHLKFYNMHSRNLHKVADMTRTYNRLIKNRMEILQMFNKLPLTEHDPHSFTVDLIYKSAVCAIIVVNGVFKQLPITLLDKERMLGFSRTFALELFPNDQGIVIVNDQLHLYNALSWQLQNSFKTVKEMKLYSAPKPTNDKEQKEFVSVLQTITDLKEDWSRKCLEEGNYDMKKSLELFVDLYKADKIPPEAFLGNVET